jgi:hypothetical protein
MDKGQINRMREIQQQTAPNMCLGASKFLALKLVRLVDPSKHLNDFLNSKWAKHHSQLPVASHWGWKISEFNHDFNAITLPAAMNNPDAGVKYPGRGTVKLQRGFDIFHDSGMADRLLYQLTPLVVGVSIHGGHSRDHFIVIFKDQTQKIWAVDPWPGFEDQAVVELTAAIPEFSFTKPTRIKLTADEGATEIPCRLPFYGWFH